MAVHTLGETVIGHGLWMVTHGMMAPGKEEAGVGIGRRDSGKRDKLKLENEEWGGSPGSEFLFRDQGK